MYCLPWQTRALLDSDGAILSSQRFAYDAYGKMLAGNLLSTSTDLTRFLYRGEQTDATGQQYLRARYYNPANGRFNRLDPFAGNLNDPQSLHKYLYAHGDPVNGMDPSGRITLTEISVSTGIGEKFALAATSAAIYGTVLRRPSGLNDLSRFAKIDTSRLQVHLHSARIRNSSRSADEVFRKLT